MRRRTLDPAPDQRAPWNLTILREINPDGSLLWPKPGRLTEMQDYFEAEGSAAFNSIFMQDPSELAGDVFNPEWYRYFCPADYVSKDGLDAKALIELGMVDRILPAPTALHRAVGVDLAVSKADVADYTAIVAGWLSVEGDLYIDYVNRARLSSLEGVREIVRICEKPRARVLGVNEDLMEKALNSLLPLIPGAQRLPWRTIPHEGKDKVLLSRPLAGHYERGRVFHRYGELWLRGFEGELAAFPGGPFDDVVDAARALYEATERYQPKSAKRLRELNEDVRVPAALPQAPPLNQRFS